MSHLPSVILITVGNQDVENPHDVFFQERYSHFPLLLQECELISYTSQPTSIHKNFIILWIILVDRTTREMIHISRINMVCLALWFIPYGILLVKEIKGNGDKCVKS